jgi:arabinogalactan oligomer/maltooligosaccharide transport system substrate-binding protein
MFNSKKKWLKTLGLVTIGSLLAACGPSEDTSSESGGAQSSDSTEGETLVVWEDIDKSSGIEEAVSEFEEMHDVTIEIVEKPIATQIEDLRLDGPAGTGPDVFTMAGDQIGTAVTEGLVNQIGIDESVMNIYSEAAMNSQIIDGSVYGLPKAVETTVLYYNKDLVSEEELPTTLEEWYDFSVEVSDGENYGLLALWDQIYYANSVMSGYGGYIFGQDAEGNYNPTDIGLNNEGAIEGLESIQSFYEEGLFPQGIIGEQGINVLDSLFTEGRAAAVISGPWNQEPFSDAGIDYGVTTLPILANGEIMSPFVGVKSYNVSSYSEHPELAEELALFIANEENTLKRYEETQEIPAIVSLAEDPIVTENEVAQAVAEQSQDAELTPNIPEMNEVWEPADAALQTIATGQADPQEAMDNAVETITGQIEANHNGQ